MGCFPHVVSSLIEALGVVDRKLRRHIDTLTGRGHLTKVDGAPLGESDYSIRRSRNYVVLATGDELPGTWHLDVTLSENHLDTFALFMSGEKVILHLQDGSSLPGYVDGARFIVGGPLTPGLP